MKHHALSLALALTALAAPLFPHSASAEVEVSFDYFQEALSPFGEWIEVADYGLCWRPTGVAEDWTPYSDGYWAYTDAGWTWVSYEDWGGITYHYGRWVHVLDEGWVWVPDYIWGPAWVSWRSSDDYVGWAPLPPEARWEESTGFSTWVDTSYDIGPDNYRFCHSYDFGAPVLAPLLLPCARNVTIIQTTVNITNICYNRSSTVIFNGGLNFVNINRRCRQQVPALKLVCEDRAPRDSHGHAPPQVLRGNQLAVFAPKVAPPADLRALPITPRRIIGADKITHGWSRVPDLAEQQQIRNKLSGQNRGLTPATAPARPVKAEELSHVPKQADPTAPPPNAIAKNRIVRPVENIAVKSQVPPTPVAPQRPAPFVALPRAVENRDGKPVGPNVNLPRVSEQVQPRIERPVIAETTPRPVQPQPFNNPRVERPARPAQVEVAPAPVQPTPPQPVVTQDAQAAQRSAEAARQQQEAAQRANELRNRQVQRVEAVRQQQEVQRANEARNQQVQQQRPQADIAARQQEAQRASEARNQQVQQQRRQADIAARQQQTAQRGSEASNQQMEQQREQARQANAARQQQEAAQHAAEFRNQQAQQAESAQRANEMRNQQAQQIAVQRAAEMHQQQAARAESARRVQQAPQSQQVQPPPPPPQQSSKPSGKDGDDDKKKHK